MLPAVTTTYDYARGVPLTETDVNGVTTTATYDTFGRMTGVTRSDDANFAIGMSYASGPPFVTVISQRVDASNVFAIRRTYDGLGREYSSETGNLDVNGAFVPVSQVDTFYDSAVQTRKSVPYQSGTTNTAWTTSLMDFITQTTTVTMPDGTQTVTATNGLSTTVTDARGNKTTTLSDVWGRTASVTPKDSAGNGFGPNVTHTYDILDRLKTATRGGVTTTLNYDFAGRKTSMSDPDMGGWTYGYDALGNLTSQTDARGCTLTLGYDALNRLTNKDSSGTGCGTQVHTSYTFDAGTNGIGRRTGMTSDSNGETISSSWTCDTRGRVATETVMGYTTEWGYNSADLPIWMEYPDGEVVNYAYTPQMMLDTVSGVSNYVTDTTYDSAGRLQSRGGEPF